MDRLGRKALAVGLDAVIGRQMHRPAARREGERQGFGRKEMASGPSGAKESDPLHSLSGHAVLGLAWPCGRDTMRRGSGRRRVRARRSPMPKATAIIDDPP